jgi:quercetin dioxygenase-like cupin family protein
LDIERQPVVRGPFDGEYVAVAGDRYRFLATSEETDGRYALMEAVVPPGGGPPPHRHSREEEGFYVFEGTLTIYIEGDKLEATPGSFVNLPKGSKHWFRNHTKQHAKMLILLAPGGFEAMFREAGQVIRSVHDTIPAFGDAEKQRLLAVAPKYGVQIIVEGA